MCPSRTSQQIQAHLHLHEHVFLGNPYRLQFQRYFPHDEQKVHSTLHWPEKLDPREQVRRRSV